MSPSKRRNAAAGGRSARWIIVVGALLLAAVALSLLLRAPRERDRVADEKGGRPALDDIDAKSRAAMRDLLRQDGNGE
jgi:hypothetical protein